MSRKFNEKDGKIFFDNDLFCLTIDSYNLILDIEKEEIKKGWYTYDMFKGPPFFKDFITLCKYHPEYKIFTRGLELRGLGEILGGAKKRKNIG